MKYVFVLTWLLGFSFPISGQQCPVIPLPAAYSQHKGQFILDKYVTVVTGTESERPYSYFLQKELLRYTGISVISSEKPAGVFIELKSSKLKDKRKGAYSLEINARQITLTAAEGEGMSNGISTLLQLINQSEIQKDIVKIPCWNITDAPLYGWRGLMLDESRHFFGKEKVKDILNWMAYYKLNRFHWHLTDQPGWRIEVKKYPRLALIGGVGSYSDPNSPARYYTQEDIKEIVRFAAERNIEVIPEIDMPGHATAANMAYPQFSGGGSEKYPEFTFNPGKEETYQYLSDILKETDVLFPSQMIHLGGDEVHFGNASWNTDAGVQQLMKSKQLKDLKAVEEYFIRRMADTVMRMNNKVLAWDEVAGIDLASRETIVFWWRHDKPEELKKALDKGYDAVLCPRLPLYFDFVQDSVHSVGRKWQGKYVGLKDVYRFRPEDYVKEPGQMKQVRGIQANLWTEQVSSEENLDYLLFPRIAALAESGWAAPGSSGYEEFLLRLKQHVLMYRREGVYYYDPFNPLQNPEYNIKGKKILPGL